MSKLHKAEAIRDKFSDGDPMTQPTKSKGVIDTELAHSRACRDQDVARAVAVAEYNRSEAVATFVEHLRDDFVSTTEPVKKVARLIRERFTYEGPAAVEAPRSMAESTYQQPVEKMVMEMAETLTDESPGYSLQERIAQWRKQAEGVHDEHTMGGMYASGRAFAFERCADEAELIVKRAMQSAVEAPRAPTPVAAALSLARHAVNGWACYAKRNVEHAEIRRLHSEIDDLASGCDRPAAPVSLPEPEAEFVAVVLKWAFQRFGYAGRQRILTTFASFANSFVSPKDPT